MSWQEPDTKVEDLKQRIKRGEYTVDPRAVADAILQRARRRANQTECSYPAKPSPSSPPRPSGTSTNNTPGSRWLRVTWPIQTI